MSDSNHRSESPSLQHHQDRRASITTETNTATPSAPAFVPSKERLDHSLVVHDNTGLAVHSANLPSESVRPDAYVESEPAGVAADASTRRSLVAPVSRKIPSRYFVASPAHGSSSPALAKDPEHTNDDEQVRIDSATVENTATFHEVHLAPDEFGRITADVQRVSQNHSPPDWHRDEEVDRSSVPGAEEYLKRHPQHKQYLQKHHCQHHHYQQQQRVLVSASSSVRQASAPSALRLSSKL